MNPNRKRQPENVFEPTPKKVQYIVVVKTELRVIMKLNISSKGYLS
jgi:hypothetical protein